MVKRRLPNGCSGADRRSGSRSCCQRPSRNRPVPADRSGAGCRALFVGQVDVVVHVFGGQDVHRHVVVGTGRRGFENEQVAQRSDAPVGLGFAFLGDDIVEVARFHALHIPLQRVETEQDAIAHAVRLQVFGYDVGARRDALRKNGRGFRYFAHSRTDTSSRPIAGMPAFPVL